MQDTDLRSKQRYYLDNNADISFFNTTPFADQLTTTATIRLECTTGQGEEPGRYGEKGHHDALTVANAPVSLPSANCSLPEPLSSAEFHVHNRRRWEADCRLVQCWVGQQFLLHFALRGVRFCSRQEDDLQHRFKARGRF
jgi:hypothetical protein